MAWQTNIGMGTSYDPTIHPTLQGTGTEADPFLPKTCQEFLDCVYVDGAYVKLTQSIKFQDDPVYKYGVQNEILYTNSERIYADTLTTVEGLQITSNNVFMTTIRGGIVYVNFDKIWFKNCVHNRTGDGNYLLAGHVIGSTYQTLNFNDCKFTFLIILNSAKTYLSNVYTKFNRCSEYYKYTTPTVVENNPNYILEGTRDNCMIYLDNLHTCGRSSNSGTGYGRWADLRNGSNTTIVGDVYIHPGNGDLTGGLFAHGSVIGIRFHNEMDAAINYYFTSTGGDSLLDTSVLDYTHESVITTSTNMIQLTTAEIKDPITLLEYGFLANRVED